jgi:pimeloyl-ACP methyl ester carboxylesterase
VPAVLVHGVPDTGDVWAPVVEQLTRDDVVVLRLPGFGEPVPAGFGCTKDEYAAWIVDRLRELAEPVDLVGHDWGALLTQYVGAGQPDLVRTWAAGDGPVDVEYVWHELAQMWQTPEVGEQVMQAMTVDAVDGLRAAGHPEPAACLSHVDDTMKDAILRLYRSAVTVGAEWQPTVEGNRRPALVLWGTDDPYAPAEPFGRRLAARVGGELSLVEGGHWAIFEKPDVAAAALESFWAASAP